MIHSFKVRSVRLFRGVILGFPVDMLRYDHCWPASENDSAILQSAIEAGGYRAKREYNPDEEIELAAEGNKSWMPTKDRWKSFSWEVIEYNGIRLENGR